MKSHRENGMATAEYCVGSIGAVFVAFWLAKLASGDVATSWFGQILSDVISQAFTIGDRIEQWKIPWLM